MPTLFTIKRGKKTLAEKFRYIDDPEPPAPPPPPIKVPRSVKEGVIYRSVDRAAPPHKIKGEPYSLLGAPQPLPKGTKFRTGDAIAIKVQMKGSSNIETIYLRVQASGTEDVQASVCATVWYTAIHKLDTRSWFSRVRRPYIHRHWPNAKWVDGKFYPDDRPKKGKKNGADVQS